MRCAEGFRCKVFHLVRVRRLESYAGRMRRETWPRVQGCGDTRQSTRIAASRPQNSEVTGARRGAQADDSNTGRAQTALCNQRGLKLGADSLPHRHVAICAIGAGYFCFLPQRQPRNSTEFSLQRLAVEGYI